MEKEYYFFTVKSKVIFCHLDSKDKAEYLIEKVNDPETDIDKWSNGNYECRLNESMRLDHKIFFTVLDKSTADFTQIIESVISLI